MSQILIQKKGDIEATQSSDGGLTVTVPIRITRRGKRKAITTPDGTPVQLKPWNSEPTPIQRALVRAHLWLALLEKGEASNLIDLAEKVGMDRAYVSRTLNLTTLAPEIVAAVLDETLPDQVTLMDLASGTPLLWEGQIRNVAQFQSKEPMRFSRR
jgi:hypothetical protein